MIVTSKPFLLCILQRFYWICVFALSHTLPLLAWPSSILARSSGNRRSWFPPAPTVRTAFDSGPCVWKSAFSVAAERAGGAICTVRRGAPHPAQGHVRMNPSMLCLRDRPFPRTLKVLSSTLARRTIYLQPYRLVCG